VRTGGSDRSIVAANRRRLTGILLSGLLPVLCTGVIGWPLTAAAEVGASGDELESQFNPPAGLQ